MREVRPAEAEPSPEPMVCWGIYKSRMAKQRADFRDLQAEQKRIGSLVVLERGWVHREHYYSVGWDSINGLARHPEPGSVDRWAQLGVELRPWRSGGEEVLVVGQVPWDTSCQHVPHAEWVRETCRALRPKHSRLAFRPHPLQPNAVPVGSLAVDLVDTKRSLGEALHAAKLVVTFSSTVGVDAVIRGVPTVARDPMSMVYDLCADTPTPDRSDWAHALAYKQWSLPEMSAGMPWLHLHSEAAA